MAVNALIDKGRRERVRKAVKEDGVAALLKSKGKGAELLEEPPRAQAPAVSPQPGRPVPVQTPPVPQPAPLVNQAALDLQLLYAISAGDMSKAQNVLRSGANPDSRDKSGCPAIVLAAEKGRMEFVQLLIQHKARINSTDNKDRTAVFAAAVNGHEDTLDVLIGNKANLDCPDSFGDAALHSVLKKPVQKRTFGPIAAKLVAAGANVNAVDREGNTPLILSVIYGPFYVLDELAKRADLNKKGNDGMTALMHAAKLGDKNSTGLLLVKRADLEATDAKGYTALHFAVECRNQDVAEMLLRNGARTDIVYPDGYTLLGMAKALGLSEMVKLLKSHGVRK